MNEMSHRWTRSNPRDSHRETFAGCTGRLSDGVQGEDEVVAVAGKVVGDEEWDRDWRSVFN
jgi:hypothetical protein